MRLSIDLVLRMHCVIFTVVPPQNFAPLIIEIEGFGMSANFSIQKSLYVLRGDIGNTILVQGL